eukprot:363865-Chlamydomonas_euryale.AAC.7
MRASTRLKWLIVRPTLTADSLVLDSPPFVNDVALWHTAVHVQLRTFIVLTWRQHDFPAVTTFRPLQFKEKTRFKVKEKGEEPEKNIDGG